MADLAAQFKSCSDKVKAAGDNKTLTTSNDDALVFYKYFKQATVGDASGPKPGMFDFTGKAKYGAWESVKGTTKEAAMQAYIAHAAKFKITP